MLIDSHCHIHDQDTYKFALSRTRGLNPENYTPEKLLARARENGIEKLICIGTSHEDSLNAQAFAKKHDNVFWAYGIHPDEAAQGVLQNNGFGPLGKIDNTYLSEERPNTRSSEDRLGVVDFVNSRRAVARSEEPPELPSLVAIGEIGLDYHHGTKTKEPQLKLLEQMLDLATRNNLPCIFHVREAFDDFFAVMRNFPSIKRAVIHSFSDSRENLEKCLNAGYYIGVNGLATFTNIPLAPLERTLLETDSPFLAPVPHRGEVDEPAFIKNIANFLAIHYQTTAEEVAKITTKNAETLFGI